MPTFNVGEAKQKLDELVAEFAQGDTTDVLILDDAGRPAARLVSIAQQEVLEGLAAQIVYLQQQLASMHQTTQDLLNAQKMARVKNRAHQVVSAYAMDSALLAKNWHPDVQVDAKANKLAVMKNRIHNSPRRGLAWMLVRQPHSSVKWQSIEEALAGQFFTSVGTGDYHTILGKFLASYSAREVPPLSLPAFKSKEPSVEATSKPSLLGIGAAKRRKVPDDINGANDDIQAMFEGGPA